MGFPTSIFSPTTKNTGDTVQASHVNDLQTEIVAIETAALSGSWTVPNQPRVHAVASVSQTISSSESTGTRVAYGTVYHEIGGGWSTATNQYTAPSSGTYFIHASVGFVVGDPTGSIGLYGNNSTAVFEFDFVSTLTGPNHLVVTSRLGQGDVVHVGVNMNSTVSRNTLGAQYSKLTIVKLC